MTEMSRKLNVNLTLKYAIIEAIAFCIPVFFFIKSANYTKSWLLFLGILLFMIVTIFHTMAESHNRPVSESIFTLVFNSTVITVVGIIFTCILCFLLLSIMVPGYLNSGVAGKQLANAPSNTIDDKTNGLSFKIFLTAVVGNFMAGSFAGLIVPFYSTRNREKVSGELYPLKENKL
jgi:hypothetical protein